jgi:hypothetical protein
MNERIKQLLNQAGIYQPDRFDAIDGSNQMEKFAELLVTKCAVIATRCESNGNKNIGAEILEYFGVER